MHTDITRETGVGERERERERDMDGREREREKDKKREEWGDGDRDRDENERWGGRKIERKILRETGVEDREKERRGGERQS